MVRERKRERERERDKQTDRQTERKRENDFHKIVIHSIGERIELTKKEYKSRHEGVDTGIHKEFCKWLTKQTAYVLTRTCPAKLNKILYDFKIQTVYLIPDRR